MPNRGTRGRSAVLGSSGAFNDDAGTPAAVAAAGSVGTSPNTARANHAHPHGTGYLPDAHHAQSHVLNGSDHTYPRAAKSADYTATAADFVLDFDTGSSTNKILTLPAAATAGAGKVYVVRLVAGTKSLQLARSGSDTVNGTTGANLGTAVPTAVIVRSDGVSAWYVEALYRGLTYVAPHLTTSSAVHFFDTTTLNADTTLTSNAHAVYQIDASGAARTITLPTITGTTIGEWVVIEKADASVNAVTVVGGGSDTIEGLSSFVLRAQRDRVVLYSGTFWPTVTDMWHVLAQRTGRAIVAAKTGAYTLTDADEIVPADATGGAFTLTLPTAVGRTGRVFVCKKIDASANAVTLDGAGSETIDGATTLALTAQWQSARIVSTGAAWLVV